MSSLLRWPWDDSVLGRLGARKALHRKMVRGAVDPTGKQVRRLSSWASVSSAGSPTLVMEPSDFKERYGTPDVKPKVSLVKVSIKRTTAYAPRINLSVEVDVEFEIYSHDQFETYAYAYLRRHPEKAPVTIRWGNVEGYDGRGGISHTLSGARIIAASYSTGDLNVYHCQFKAIAPAYAVKDLDMFSHMPLEFVFPGQEFKYGFLSSKKSGLEV